MASGRPEWESSKAQGPGQGISYLGPGEKLPMIEDAGSQIRCSGPLYEVEDGRAE